MAFVCQEAMSACKAAPFLCWLFLSVTNGSAQELSPRAYWPAPKDTKIMFFGYAYSFGDNVTDPSLPIFGVNLGINLGIAGYLQTLSLWNRTANIVVEIPYSWGRATGVVEGEPRRRDFAGIGDIGVTLSVNLLGAPSMTTADFQLLRKDPRPILGASVKLLAPTGDYEADKLVNVGANRWAVKTELGYIYPIKKKWLLELELGAWFFGDNNSFLGVTREQRPVGATEVHLIRRIKPGFWAALELNYFWGGRSIVGNEIRADFQSNSRIGGTIVLPFRRRHAIKIGYSTGLITALGGDYQTLLLSYNVRLW